MRNFTKILGNTSFFERYYRLNFRIFNQINIKVDIKDINVKVNTQKRDALNKMTKCPTQYKGK